MPQLHHYSRTSTTGVSNVRSAEDHRIGSEAPVGANDFKAAALPFIARPLL